VERTKEPVIYDMIEVLPEPRAEPESESEESGSEDESRSEDESESEESENRSGKESGENQIDIYGDDETIPRDVTLEPPSSPQIQQLPADPELRPQRNRKAPEQYSPEPFTKTAKYQSHASHVYKADTMWNESTSIEPQSYEEAVNHPVYGKEWTAAIQEEYDSLMKNGA
jgi:hypothetical protein